MPAKKIASEKTETTTMQQTTTPYLKRLYRSETDTIIGGVAGGLGEYFHSDPTLIRLCFIFISIFGGVGIFLYAIMWIIVPKKSDVLRPNIKGNIDEIREKAESFSSVINEKRQKDTRFLSTIILIALGVYFLSTNVSLFSFDFERVLPLVLIILGLVFIFKR